MDAGRERAAVLHPIKLQIKYGTVQSHVAYLSFVLTNVHTLTGLFVIAQLMCNKYMI